MAHIEQRIEPQSVRNVNHKGDIRAGQQRLLRHWERWGAVLIAVLLVVVLFAFLSAQHAAFGTRTYDFGRFAQAIWNTLDGRFLYTSIDNRSILGNHFSPYMALLAPLFWIWSDERVLLLAQAASVAAAGLVLALMVRRSQPALAPWFMLAYALNPAVHEMALFEFRRIVLALPYLALALYALQGRNRKLMLVGLGVALLCKEDVGLFVAGVGLFVLLFERDWRWGGGLVLFGLAWAVVVSLWVIPAFRAPGTAYPQLFYFDYLGNSYAEIWQTLRSDPFILLRQLLAVERLLALGRLLLPLGLFLPFLGAEWLVIALPPLLLLLLSGDAEMYTLVKWYPATLLPVFFAATAVGLGRISSRQARMAGAWLTAAALAGMLLFSPLPGGGNYNATLYAVDRHDDLGHQIVGLVPETASVMAQPDYVPHLVMRSEVYHYPWVSAGIDNVEYLLLDLKSGPYPFTVEELRFELDRYLTNPVYALVAEADGIFLFRRGQGEPDAAVDATAGDFMHLSGYDVAVANAEGIYVPADVGGLVVAPGRSVRVDLHWEAAADGDAQHAISVRLVDASGFLQAQHDGWPAGGARPTLSWSAGQRIRDSHYLTVPPDAPDGPLALVILVYRAANGETVPFAEGDAVALGTISVDAGAG